MYKYFNNKIVFLLQVKDFKSYFHQFHSQGVTGQSERMYVQVGQLNQSLTIFEKMKLTLIPIHFKID